MHDSGGWDGKRAAVGACQNCGALMVMLVIDLVGLFEGPIVGIVTPDDTMMRALRERCPEALDAALLDAARVVEREED